MATPLLRSALIALLAATTLAGCDRGNQTKTTSNIPQIAKSETVPQEVGGIEGATPMAERVAVLGLLNKRNGLVQDLTMKPGDTARVGRAIVRGLGVQGTPRAQRDPAPDL